MKKLKEYKDINILFVDDDVIEREIAFSRLAAIFDNIFFAENGLEALKIFNEQNIDLIITDITMPLMDGVKLIKSIREINYWVPIIVITSDDSKEILYECTNLSIQAFLSKPLSKSAFFDVINRVLKFIQISKIEKIELISNIFYNPEKCQIENGNIINPLTKNEKILLDLFLDHKNSLISYEKISYFIWEKDDKQMSENSLKTLIKNLRNKTSKDLIINISGLGYKLISK